MSDLPDIILKNSDQRSLSPGAVGFQVVTMAAISVCLPSSSRPIPYVLHFRLSWSPFSHSVSCDQTIRCASPRTIQLTQPEHPLERLFMNPRSNTMSATRSLRRYQTLSSVGSPHSYIPRNLSFWTRSGQTPSHSFDSLECYAGCSQLFPSSAVVSSSPSTSTTTPRSTRARLKMSSSSSLSETSVVPGSGHMWS